MNDLITRLRSPQTMSQFTGTADMYEELNLQRMLAADEIERLQREVEVQAYWGERWVQQHAECQLLRGLLLWTLYHHQGGSSDIGQPIRRALGIGQHDRLTAEQIAEAKAAAALPANADGKRTL